MKALTVRQPWAEVICTGEKTVEVRSRPTKHRGPLAIHSSAKPDAGLEQHCEGLPLGEVVCVVNVIGCRPLTLADLPAAYMEPEWFEEGRWAWLLADVRRVQPFAVKGKLGLWQVPDELVIYAD